MDWSSFWSAASAVAAIGVLLVTGVYAWLTFRLAKAAELQIWESSRARMSVSATTNQGGQLLLLEFENVGGSPAGDLQVRIDRPLYQQLGSERLVTDAPFFNEGVRAFPAKRSIKFALGVTFRWLSEETDRTRHPSTFDIATTYRTLGKTITESFPIDIERYFSLSAVDKDYTEEFGRTFPDEFKRSMRDINRSLADIAKPIPQIPQKKSWSGWFSKQVWQESRWK
jgi:hypothetical protein